MTILSNLRERMRASIEAQAQARAHERAEWLERCAEEEARQIAEAIAREVAARERGARINAEAAAELARTRAAPPTDPFAKATERSKTLLVDWLSREQLKQYALHKYFDVIGGDSGKTYRINEAHVFNILELDAEGKPAIKHCVVPRARLGEPIPIGDQMLAQKFALEKDEKATIDLANHSPVPTLTFDDYAERILRPVVDRICDPVAGS